MEVAKTRKPKRLSQRQKATLERFAAVCGISLDLALVFRDDLALVGLDLPTISGRRGD